MFLDTFSTQQFVFHYLTIETAPSRLSRLTIKKHVLCSGIVKIHEQPIKLLMCMYISTRYKNTPRDLRVIPCSCSPIDCAFQYKEDEDKQHRNDHSKV